MLDRPISEIPLVFLDTETTGLNPHFGDRVVEIALARFRGDVMEDHYVSLVDPGRKIPLRVTQIHGITDSDVRGQPTFAEILPQLQEQLEEVVIVGHNAPFDLGFLVKEFRLARQQPPNNLVLDTLSFLRAHYNLPSNSLPRVAEYFRIDRKTAHRALADALTTHDVFAKVVQDLSRTRRARTLGDYLNLQGGNIEWHQNDGADLPLPPALDEALRTNRRLFIRYQSENGQRTERWISPRAVYKQREVIHIFAFCHLRGDERQFRLDRVIEMTVEGSA